uniref:Structural polyprotein n=1 Tax=Rocky Mountain birnavirus TaxID=3077841 RepID=A0AA96HCZ7_9VIRU|nr:VP2-VP4-VP3 [Rocky Mountain birnavirus]
MKNNNANNRQSLKTMAMKPIVPYLKSVLLPESGPAAIPDDVVERHILKQETTTYNLQVGASGSGLIVFFPGSPSSRVGAHYIWDAQTARHTFDQWLQTSQELSESYNYSRLISRKMTVQSSTLPAGQYQLNGTVNASTFEGSLSEVEKLDYNSIMSSTANPQDKVSNQLIGDGIVVLNLPTGFDKPYVRLEDDVPKDPASRPGAEMKCAASIWPRKYEMALRADTSITFPATDTFVTLVGGNVDIMTSTDVSGDINLETQNPVQNDCIYTVSLDMLGLDGDATTRDELVLTLEWKGKIPAGETKCTIPIVGQIPSSYIDQPITSAILRIKCEQQMELQNPVTLGGTNAPCVVMTSGNGNLAGTLRPITLVAYEKVAPNSIVTVAGWSNYELIPNPNLLRNMQTTYGKYDPEALNYTKMILSHRDELDLKTVWRKKDYEGRARTILEMVDMSSDLPTNKAWGWRDLIKTIRKIAAPALSAAFPAFAPLVQGVDQAVGAIMGEAAGGRFKTSKARAAGGRFQLRAMGGEDGGDMTYSPWLKLALSDPSAQTVELCVTRGIIIPTVVSSFKDPDKGYGALYLLTDGDYTTDLPEEARDILCFTEGDGCVHGGEGTLDWACDNEYSLLPFAGFSPAGNPMIRLHSAPPISGTSMQLALQLLDEDAVTEGVPRGVFTGEVSTDDYETLIPVLGINLKRRAAHEMGLPLIGPNEGCDIKVSNVEEASYEATHEILPVIQITATSRPQIPLWESTHMASSINGLMDKLWTAAHEEEADDVIKMLEVMIWMDENDIVDEVAAWKDADPDGAKFRRLVAHAPQQKHKGPSQAEAQYLKAVRISEAAILAGSTFATPEWIESNGYAGPSPGQFKYFMTTGNEPEPLDPYTDYVTKPISRPTDFTKIQRVANNIFGNPNQEPAPKEFVDLVTAVYERNGGRGPDADDMAELREEARRIKRKHPTTARSREKPRAGPERGERSGGRSSRFRPSSSGEA